MLKAQLSIILDICSSYNVKVSKEQLIQLSKIPQHKITDAINIFYAAPCANKKYIINAILNKEFMASPMYLKLVYYVANYDSEKIKDLLNIINCYKITEMPNFDSLITLYYEVTNRNTYMLKRSDESIELLCDNSTTISDINPNKIVSRIRKLYKEFISNYDTIYFEDVKESDSLLEHISAEFLIHDPEEKIDADKLMLNRKAKIVKYNKIG